MPAELTAPVGTLGYAIVDATGTILTQGYANSDTLDSVEIPEGCFLHLTARPLNKEKAYASIPDDMVNSEWLYRTAPDTIFPSLVETDDANAVTLPAPAGTTVTTSDEVVHSESGGEITITFPGEGPQFTRTTAPGKSYRSERVRVRSLATLKLALKGEIDRVRDERLLADLTVGGITLNGDANSQQNITDAAIQGAFATLAGAPYSAQWIARDNSVISLSAAQLADLTTAIGIRKTAEYQSARTAKDNVIAATSTAEAEAARDAYLA